MTSKTKTVLILGAGASHGYGFPVGSQLRQKILALGDNDEASNVMMRSKASIRFFVDAFREAQLYSIDSFLGRRREFVDVGKAAIAYILLSCEQKADLTNEANDDHWYQFLVNELASEAWDTFDPSWLSVVTFNYDRSLLHYLTVALRHTYNKSLEEVVQRLGSVRMVHVYGRLGDPISSIPFGGLQDDAMEHYVRAAEKELVIIPEGRDDLPTVVAAQKLIESAERICFLGFGFDATNVRRLGAPGGFLNQYQVPKRTIATRIGLTDAECQRAIFGLFGNDGAKNNQWNNFYKLNCIGTLRESLILD